jgi:hypothetical protein
MRSIFEQQYYDAIRSYVPEDAKRVLDEQVPVIRQRVADEIDAFTESLSTDIKKVLDENAEEQTQHLRDLRATIAPTLTALGAGSPELKETAKALQEALDAYESKFKTCGHAARSAVNGVAKAYGIPLSFP